MTQSVFIRDIGAIAPAQVFAAFAQDEHIAFLDSGGTAGPRSRYSYIGVMPRHVLQSFSADTKLWQELRAHLAAMPAVNVPGVPFTNGAIGFLGYGMAASLDRFAVRTEKSLDLPCFCFGFYDVVFVFDHVENRHLLIASGDNAEQRGLLALSRLDRPVLLAGSPALHFAEETPKTLYTQKIARILGYIEAGDLYQANFTTRFVAPRPEGFLPAAAYLKLRQESAAPYSAYIAAGHGMALATVSPEQFLTLDSTGNIVTRPIKGTIRRGASPAEDAALAATLAASAKDRAENLMIVDLLRNDLSRIAAPGSVFVPMLCEPEIFASVIHLVSEIRARLALPYDAIDLLCASFPGGSITGAPKIRACEIIAELEIAERGPYCGAIVALAADGTMDSAISIRTVTFGKRTIAAQAGSGIVADSDPDLEYAEMRLKAAALLRALS
jgi:para-aminobenzoate synthetase component 1